MKAAIREKILRLRKGLRFDQIRAWSAEISLNLFSLEEYLQSRNVLYFLSLEREVQTGEMIERALGMGQKVFVPIVDREAGELKITGLPGLDIEFDAGPYGIREPARSFWDLVSPEVLDCIVAPGLAFDLRGGRIGYGAGYFDDLFLKVNPKAHRLAVAFDFQVLDSVPQTERDVNVEVIVTDKRVLRCKC